MEILTTLRDGGAAFGAFSGGSVVGFAAVAGQRLGSRKQYADLSLFYVSEPFRGRGIGKKLLEDAKKGRQLLTLAVYRENQGAERFYRREGFLPLEERVDEATGHPELLMVWRADE